MTIHPHHDQHCPLDPATLATMIRGVLDALPHHPNATPEEIADKREAALLYLASCRPRDCFEAGRAARLVTGHHMFMEAARCAAQPDLPDAVRLRYQGKMVALGRMMVAGERDLRQGRYEPPAQPVALPRAASVTRPQPAPAEVPPGQPAAAKTQAPPQPTAAPRPPPAVTPPPQSGPGHAGVAHPGTPGVGPIASQRAA